MFSLQRSHRTTPWALWRGSIYVRKNPKLGDYESIHFRNLLFHFNVLCCPDKDLIQTSFDLVFNRHSQILAGSAYLRNQNDRYFSALLIELKQIPHQVIITFLMRKVFNQKYQNAHLKSVLKVRQFFRHFVSHFKFVCY